MKIELISALTMISLLASGCRDNEAKTSSEEKVPTTPVTVTTPETTSMEDEIALNVTSTYLLKTDVKAALNGYIYKTNIQFGDKVRKGEILFRLQTKEAKSLGNTITKLDPDFHFTGLNQIVCPTSGYVVMYNHQKGDYVQEGETLATISDRNSFGFILNLPYELNGILSKNKEIKISLPDGKEVIGSVGKILPELDSASQTQRIFIKIKQTINLPENLVAKAVLIKNKVLKAVTVPKQAILSDENQATFWVMKMINNTTAVRVNIKKGIEKGDRVQIIEPQLTESDRILLTGNYGLADTAKVSIQKASTLQ